MLRKLSHIGLIGLLLVSTMGMTINLHYCQHKLYDIGIFGQAEKCCIPHDKSHHSKKEHHCKATNHHKDDCEDETIHIESVDNFVVPSFSFEFDDIHLIQLFVLNAIFSDLSYLSSYAKKTEISPENISPPKIHVPLSLLQTYLL